MRALLVKDWIVSRKLLILSLIILILVFFVVSDDQIPLILGLLISLFNMRNIDGLEDKNEYHALIQSMPVSRLEVVISKTIFHFLQVGINLSLIILLNNILPNLKANSIKEIFLTVAMAIMLILGYQLLYIIFGPVFMSYVTIIIFLVLIMFGWTLANSPFIQGVLKWLTSIKSATLILSSALIVLVVSALLLFLTVKVYESKDL
ncbi:hypothetical protein AWM75_01375 [Aerococcus urinaehominis]|uniref:Uncharacterized protein n=1 Tax=Aerococcus urinaehominis TaxID=128944 RepID=A0A0X8FK06_9LACT|nr:ABC-2 transporter permease [Aerococcus urinaehominis]AMB98728.1 hypothetical protein AWM75_01375 [Aerococcus urinaehominis]SDM00317.1 ABC-2 family transporter protein [Aerococcus urinaehominis]